VLAVDLIRMAEMNQLDLKTKGREARIRALLEDVTGYHMGIYPENRLALAVWFGKSSFILFHSSTERFYRGSSWLVYV